MGLGASILLIAFIPVALFVREPPSAKPAPGGAPPATGVSAGEAVRSSQFWIINIAFFLATIAINGTLAHVVALLTDRGIPAATATDALSVAGLAWLTPRLPWRPRRGTGDPCGGWHPGLAAKPGPEQPVHRNCGRIPVFTNYGNLNNLG